MTKEFKVGDTVTDIILGKKGEVVRNNDCYSHPILVAFENGTTESYSDKGYFDEFKDAIPRLYHGEVTIEIKQPVYEYQVIYKHKCCVYEMSCGYYRDGEEFNLCNSGEFIELYQPSKRVRK